MVPNAPRLVAAVGFLNITGLAVALHTTQAPAAPTQSVVSGGRVYFPDPCKGIGCRPGMFAPASADQWNQRARTSVWSFTYPAKDPVLTGTPAVLTGREKENYPDGLGRAGVIKI